MQPPIAKQVPYVHQNHGDKREDPYHWLRNKNDPAVIEYLKAENAYAQEQFKPIKTLKDTIFKETVSRIQETDQDIPWSYGNYDYYFRTVEGLQHDIFCRRSKAKPDEEIVLFDENEFSDATDFFEVGTYALSMDQRWMAITIDTTGDECYELWLKDLHSGSLKKGLLSDIAPGVVFSSNHHDLWYCRFDETHRPYQVWCYDIYQKSSDIMLLQEDDARFWLGVSRSETDKYLLVNVHSKITSEVHYTFSDQPRSTLKCFYKRDSGHEYDIEHYENHFYIHTNSDAKNFKLMRCPLDNTDISAWEEVIPHELSVCIEGFGVFKDYFVLSERRDGLAQLHIFNPHTQENHWIEFPDVTYACGLESNWEYDTEIVRVYYSSMNTPASVFAYNMRTYERTLLKQNPVLGGYNPDDYHSDRVNAVSQDGESIPISLVYKKSEFKKDMPVLLIGYGSYGVDMDPWFSYARISLLDRGVIYAIAHIRGGGEFGEEWHDEGKLMHKKNTFDDFIACSKFLISEGYTSPEQLFITGGSAGGLLVGAVMNEEPELFRGVIAHVPFVDILSTMLDESLPLTITEYEEWGNPNEKIPYEYIKSYSPYDNVSNLPYPSVFMTCGLEDPLVPFWEAAKWAAKLRQHSVSDNAIILKVNLSAGHQGQSGRYNAIEEVAEEFAFVMGVLSGDV